MNKFLLILLIVVVVSSEVQHLDMRKLGNPNALIQWLMVHRYYDQLGRIAKQYGRPKAISFCQSKVPDPYLRESCPEVVERFFR